jgi:hypothetical protein
MFPISERLWDLEAPCSPPDVVRMREDGGVWAWVKGDRGKPSPDSEPPHTGSRSESHPFPQAAAAALHLKRPHINFLLVPSWCLPNTMMEINRPRLGKQISRLFLPSPGWKLGLPRWLQPSVLVGARPSPSTASWAPTALPRAPLPVESGTTPRQSSGDPPKK